MRVGERAWPLAEAGAVMIVLHLVRAGTMWVWLPMILALLSPMSLVAVLRHFLLIVNGSLGPWALAQGPLHGCALLWVQPQHYDRTSLHRKEHPWVYRSVHADCWFALAHIDQYQFWCCWWTWDRHSVQHFQCQYAVGWFSWDSEPWAGDWCTRGNKHTLWHGTQKFILPFHKSFQDRKCLMFVHTVIMLCAHEFLW